jgi:ABC-type branched-subunit amino acid transport system permease subunit
MRAAVVQMIPAVVVGASVGALVLVYWSRALRSLEYRRPYPSFARIMLGIVFLLVSWVGD